MRATGGRLNIDDLRRVMPKNHSPTATLADVVCHFPRRVHSWGLAVTNSRAQPVCPLDSGHRC